MSQVPGFTLEDYVYWEFGRMIGTVPDQIPHRIIKPDVHSELVEFYEPYRKQVEEILLNYNEEDHGSWRTYAPYAFEFLPEPPKKAIRRNEQWIEMQVVYAGKCPKCGNKSLMKKEYKRMCFKCDYSITFDKPEDVY